jgi:hypothetical protein
MNATRPRVARRQWRPSSVVVLLVSFVLPLLAFPPLPQNGPDSPKLATLHLWKDAVARHEPGLWDPSAIEISGWSADRLSDVLDGLREEKGGASERDAILQRGAALHADIAMFSPGGPLAVSTANTSVLVYDGQATGTRAEPIHWRFGRQLLDRLRSEPATYPFVHAWYRATAAFLAGAYQLDDLLRHLDHARLVLPDDAEIQFASGCLSETFAQPRIQAMVQNQGKTGPRVNVPPLDRNLSNAERFFRRALAIDPRFVEARIRLGRILGLQGSHKDAIETLREGLAGPADLYVRYYGELFLGAELQQAGDAIGARAAYERAAALFPRAQSPYLSLSLIADERGARGDTLQAMRRLADLPGAAHLREDPWWRYDAGSGRREDFLLGLLRRATVALGPR